MSCFSQLLTTCTQSNNIRSILKFPFILEAEVHSCSVEIAVLTFSECSLEDICGIDIIQWSCGFWFCNCIIKERHHRLRFQFFWFFLFLKQFFYKRHGAFSFNDNILLYLTKIVSKAKTSFISQNSLVETL